MLLKSVKKNLREAMYMLKVKNNLSKLALANSGTRKHFNGELELFDLPLFN